MSRKTSTMEFSSSMKRMERPRMDERDKFPRHVVPSASHEKSGITFSVEEKGNSADAKAEYEVLKSILNRESYLTRLHSVVRTVGKKFKPEVADVLDLVRAASLDVIDSLLKWREVKKDHDAAFIWNGINYLLKMPSDLDYLSEYLAINRWMGFSLERNPFCVPYAMEEGAAVYNDHILNPQHIDKGRTTDGYVIGGLSQSRLKKKYQVRPATKGSSEQKERNSPYAPTILMSKSMGSVPVSTNTLQAEPQTFIFNDDMTKIRQAELVILKEEQKFGIHMRDPDGKIAPRLQALTRIAAVELKRDDRRPIEEPAVTQTHAPHAEKSDIGIKKNVWVPEKAKLGSEEIQRTAALREKYITDVDTTIKPKTRGEGKGGGILAPLELRGVESHPRRPLKTNLAADIEFRRHREMSTLSKKLEEIRILKEQIKVEKLKELQEKQLQSSRFGVVADIISNQNANSPSKKVGNLKNILTRSKTSSQLPTRRSPQSSPSPTMRKQLTRQKTDSSLIQPNQGGQTSPVGNIRKTRESLSAGALSRPTSGKSMVEKLRKNVSSGHMPPTSPLASPTPSRKSRRYDKDDDESSADESVATSVSANSRSTKGAKVGNHSEQESEIGSDSYSDTGSRGNTRSGRKSSVLKPKSKSSRMSKRVKSKRKKADDIEPTEADFDEETRKQLEVMDKEIELTSHHLSRAIAKEEKIATFKVNERNQKNNEKSRQIERKRRLLTEDEAKREGPPPEEPANIYDFYSIVAQKAIRGWLARCWIKWYKDVSCKARLKLQAAMRGFLGRVRVRRIRVQYIAARTIQRNFRGWSTRGTSSSLAKSKNLGRSCISIQRVWRGVLGRRRAISKRKLDEAAQLAFECVDDKTIMVEDIKELGKRILYAIEEPSTTDFPPDEVLYLIRLVTMIIQAPRGKLGLVHYDFFDVRSYDEMDGDNLSWLEAAKMVNRAERFMRLIRTMAFGPGAKPPRLVQVPSNANLMYIAQAKNPRWKLSTFETMGIGAKICCQLFKWITSIVEISARQQEFLNLIASSFPDWLPKLYELQRTSRLCEFELELNRKCVDVVVEFMNINSNDEILFSAIEKELLLVKRNVIDSKGRLKDALVEIDKLKSDQAAREVYALEAMVEKCNSAKEEKDELLHLFQQNLTLSKQGDRGATESLAELRHQISNQQLKVSELDSQKKILEMQVEGNRLKRTNPARLPSDVTAKAVLAGEAKAGYVLAIGHAKAMLHSSGVKHASDLPVHLLDIYDTLAAKEFAARTEARKLFLEADEDRKMYDDYLQRLLTEAEMKEQKSKDRFTPTDKELEEERIEDDREAVYERLKHRQYIPDHAINSFPLQRRPIIVALARDVPAYTKDKIFNYITTNMPGRYITVDNESNCGFNVESMQAVLDANKNIILHVDHGLTRLSRDTFLKNFEITMQALIPQPAIVLVIGNESNRRGLEVHYGAGKRDVQLMKDGDIKSGLETVAWIVSEFRKHEIRSLMQKTSRLVFPPSEVFAFVLQAFFMVVSSDDNENDEYSLPDETLAGVAWRATRKILLESWHIIERIEAIKRGRSTSRQRACISKFIHSPIWPVKYSIERASDIVLNLLALFVEEFLKIETITNERGGTPLQALTKTSIKGFQAVLVATDGVNTKDTLTCSEGQNFKVFRECGWRVICAKTLKSILQDRRVSKLVTKLDNGGHYHVNVYRDEFNIYFEAYDPTTSETFMTKVSVGEVPSLLIPNANDRENNINTIPPQSPKEMYEQLLKLLRFDKESKKVEERKTLTCRRDSIFLMNATRKINGYFVLLKCYEAALGELFFSAYIPEFSASIKLTVNDTIRKGILDNVDCGGLTKESENSNSQDPKPLLPFIIDRLQMTPSSSILRAKGLVRHSRKASPKSSISQGFSMKARVHGGVGRILLRRLIRFYDVLHLIELRLSTPQKVLIIRVYEPVQQHTMTLQLSAYHRLLLLGNLSENHLDWYDKLLKRLRVNWRGSHSLRLDYSLFTTVLRINGKRLVAKIILVDELHIQVVLTELASSIKYYCTMNQQEVMLLLLYKPPLVAIQEDLGLNKLPKSIDKTIVESIQPEYNAPPIALSAEEENARFLSLLRDKNVLRNLASLLQSTLKPMYDGDAVRSYISYQGPLQAHFTMNFSKVSKVEDNSVVNEAEEGTNDGEVEDDKLQTAIRYESCMKQRVRDGTINSLLITRKQMPIVNMDSALNHMVRERANKSEVQRRLAILAGLSVEKHLDTLFTDAEKDQAIDRATRSVIEDILNEMQDKVMIRARQREVPVIIPPENYDELEGEEEDRMRRLAQDLAEVTSITDPDKMLVGKQEKLIFDGGIKTNYRDGKVRWHGHVSVKVYETPCWMGEDGQGNQYKFVVYEPNVASYFEGHIKSMKHLKEILGVAGQDLLDKKKSKEMAMFICKHRLDVVLNNKTWDGVEVEEGEPHYRIEFQSDRLYTADKVTPINAAEEMDEEANKDKLIEIENARGKKIVRLVRRVSGLLMQLTVFDLPQAVVSAAFNPVEDAVEAPLVAEDSGEVLASNHSMASQKSSQANGQISTIPASDSQEVIAVTDGLSRPEGEPEDIEKPQSPTASMVAQTVGSSAKGFAEDRENTSVLERHPPPAFRIIGYDPRSRRKAVVIVEPQAVLEVCGGVFSPYLHPDRRRELAKTVCDTLVLVFTSGRPFELVVPWSGATKEITTATVSKEATKISDRSSADRVIKRDGKLFRSVLRVSKYDLLVSVYGPSSEFIAAANARNDNDNPLLRQIIFNFYSPAVSEAAEVAVSEQDQIDRIGKPVLHFTEGTIRSAAIRKLSRFFRAEIIIDVLDEKIRTLEVDLLPPSKDFVSDYQQVSVPPPGEDLRPVGIPDVFYPLDSCGNMLHRRGMSLKCRDKSKPNKEFVVSVYTKTELETPERGLVIKLYDRTICSNAILHVGPSELIRICDHAEEFDLLRDISYAINREEALQLDEVEENFTEFTEKGTLRNNTRQLIARLMNVVLNDLGFMYNALDMVIPYIKSGPKGRFPSGF